MNGDGSLLSQPSQNANSGDDDTHQVHELSELHKPEFLQHDFASVMQAIRLNDLAKLAAQVRQTRDQVKGITQSKCVSFDCVVTAEPLFGYNNLIYIIVFSDQEKWVARIPKHGHAGNKSLATKMDSECHTVRYIQARTIIPIPEMFYWTTSTEKIGSAVVLMAYAEGEMVSRVWYKMNLEQQLRVLSEFASSMSQLAQLSFDKIGMLRFTDDGKTIGVGSYIRLLPQRYDDEINLCCTDATLVIKKAEFDDWDRREPLFEHTASNAAILQMAIDSIPAYMMDQSFTLTPNDTNPNNILVDDEGRITAIIDWDDVHIDAPSVGSRGYPEWIYQHWITVDHDEDADWPEKAAPATEPRCLGFWRYRLYYSQQMDKLLSDTKGYEPRVTRLSHILQEIWYGTAYPVTRPLHITKLLNHAFRSSRDFSLEEYADAHAWGNTAQFDARIKRAFAYMWRAEWEERDGVERSY